MHGSALSITFILTAFLASPSPVSGAESVNTAEWHITADRITRYEKPASIVAEGSIVLEKRIKLPPRVPKIKDSRSRWADLLGEPSRPGVTASQVEEAVDTRYRTEAVIEADWLRYDVDNKLIQARGHVKLIGRDDTLTAESAQVDMKTETGSFTDAVVIREKDEIHLEGQTIEKTGINTYHIVDGWAVTCPVAEGETPPWSIASKDTEVTEGGYAVMKNATFNIKGIPIFYTPYMIVPVKNTRQSGFLLPEFAHSSTGGFGMDLPYFWAISDSMDVTLFPEFYVDRGVMPGFEYRYVYTEHSRGALMANYLHDSLSDGDLGSAYYQDTDFTHTNSHRYWLRGKVDHDFGDWQGRLDIDIVSDRDYLTEFNSGYTGFKETDNRFFHDFGRGFDNKTEDTRLNLLTLLRSWNTMSLQANLLGYNDVRTNDDPDEDPLWTLPEVSFTGIQPLDFGQLSFNWTTSYVNYWREDGVGGQRLDLHPSLSAPIPLSPYLESRAEAGVRETLYLIETYGDSSWDEDDTQSRLLADFTFEVASPLMRTFNFADGDSLYHRVRPFVRYLYLPEVDQDDLPEFDTLDQIDDQSTITYGVDNFFDGTFGDSAREIGFLKVKQSYNFLAEEEFSDINMRIRLTPLKSLYFEYETDYNVHGDGFVVHSLLGSYSNSRGDSFSLDYSYNDQEDDRIEQINFATRYQLLPRWSTAFEIEHSIAEGKTNEANLSLLYSQPCWSLEFQTEYTPSDTRFLLVLNLANIGSPMSFDL